MIECELYHWGIKGMKWGIRRFQNPNGSLTPEGKKRYAANAKEAASKYSETWRSEGMSLRGKQELARSQEIDDIYYNSGLKSARARMEELDKEYNELRDKAQKKLYNDPELLDKYDRKAAKLMAEQEGDISFEEALRGIKYDDYGQGNYDPLDFYLNDIPEVKAIERKRTEAYVAHRNACKKAAKEYLGLYANVPVDKYMTTYPEIGKRVVSRIGTMPLSDVYAEALDYRRIDESFDKYRVKT